MTNVSRQSRYAKTEKGKANRRRFAKTEKGKALQRRYDQSSKGKARRAKANRRWREANPKQYAANVAVTAAIKRGDLVRPDACSLCSGNAVRIEASHDNYDLPLEVVWLCQPCHRRKDGHTYGE